jgi:hypothetical protein
MSEAVRSAVTQGPTFVACLNVNGLPQAIWRSPRTGELGSTRVAVVAPRGEQRLQVLVFRYGASVLDLPLPEGASEVAFGGDLRTASQNGWRLTESGLSVLQELVAVAAGAQVEWRPQRFWPIIASDLVPGWRRASAYLVERRLHDGRREMRIARADGSQGWADGSPPDPFFSILANAPQGAVASLLAASPGFDRTLYLPRERGRPPVWSPDCTLLMAHDPGRFVVAVDGSRQGIARVVGAIAVPGGPFQTRLCRRLAAGGRESEIIAAYDVLEEKFVLAGRLAGAAAPPRWWLA